MDNEIKMVSGYFTTQDLCQRYDCSSRTIFRWAKRKKLPFPQPRLKASGSTNRWAIEDVSQWEQAANSQNAA